MAKSSLATVDKPAARNLVYGPRNHVIDSVVIHTMAGDNSAAGCGDWFQSGKALGSTNYGVDTKGVIGVYVDESEAPHATNSSGVDHRAISIEVASINDSTNECSGEAYESLIRLLVDVCQRNNIKGLLWKADEAYGKAAANGGPVTEQNMFAHRWFSPDGKTCPGDYLYAREGQIANEVNQRLKNGISYQGPGATSTSSADGTSTSSGALVPAATVDYTLFDPYMITLTRQSKDVPYSKLKENNISGALLEAGYLYNASGNEVNIFESPELYKQVAKLKKQNIPFGMFMYARAKTIDEASAEIYQFSFPLRRYTPELGVWLQLELGKNKKTNSKILDKYKLALTRLGYGQRCGIICDRETLEKNIDWTTYQEEFYLWLVDHVKDTSEFTKLLDPEFFDVVITPEEESKDTKKKKTVKNKA